jgi:MFS family permease
MAFIDSTAVNVALPVIQANLNASIGDLQWTINAYTIFLA